LDKKKPCPFCGGYISTVVCDNEGNIRDKKYEKEPWSGLGYILVHEIMENITCPIAQYEIEPVGMWIYESREEAAAIWNQRV